MINRTLKTKTLKIESKKFHKVRIEMTIIDTRYTFFDVKGKETKQTIMRGFGDNEKFTRTILGELDITKQSIDEIVEVLKSVYIMDLTHLSV